MIQDRILKKEGYVILEKFIPSLLISDFIKVLPNLKPVRAIDSENNYAERNDIKNLKDISVWWSQEVDNLKETIAIKRLVTPLIQDHFAKLVPYISDVVTINKKSQYVKPHVDTPHRFKPWNFTNSLLGIQCIIPLMNVTKENGSTGLVPFSHKRDFDIDECYQGKYNRWFLDNCTQHNMSKGSLLFYNCRTLHSSMPNNTDIDRPALLINYLDRSIIDEVRKLDNVWMSNGKSS